MLAPAPKFSVEESESLPWVEPSLLGGSMSTSSSVMPLAFSAAESKVKRLGILAAAWLSVAGFRASKEGSGALPVPGPTVGSRPRYDGDFCLNEDPVAAACSATRSSLVIEMSDSLPLLMRFINRCCTAFAGWFVQRV